MKSFKAITVVSLIINFLAILTIVLLRNKIPPVVPLFYGLPVSANELVPGIGLILPAVIALILTLINFLLAKATKDAFLEKILAGLIITITALSTITIVKIFLLVGSF